MYSVHTDDGRFVSEADTIQAARAACRQHEDDGEQLPFDLRGPRDQHLETYLGGGVWRTSDIVREHDGRSS